MKTSILAVLALVGSSVFASGWRCASDGGSWKVKLYNQLRATSKPAKLVVTKRGETVIAADADEIGMQIEDDGTSYTAPAGKLDAESVEFFVRHREGQDSVEEGTRRAGKLMLMDEEGDVTKTVHLVCRRYLKSE